MSSTPRGLRAAGRRLWVATTTDFELDETATAVLAEACHTVDELAGLRAKLADVEPVIESKQGRGFTHCWSRFGCGGSRWRS